MSQMHGGVSRLYVCLLCILERNLDGGMLRLEVDRKGKERKGKERKGKEIRLPKLNGTRELKEYELAEGFRVGILAAPYPDSCSVWSEGLRIPSAGVGIYRAISDNWLGFDSG